MNRIIITDLPKPHDEVKGCWYNGYPIHKGYTENSLNYATVYSHQNHILPDLKRIKNDFKNFNKYDMIFCRYVLIYFSNEFKFEVLEKISKVLNTNGTLFLGNAELLLAYDKFFDIEKYEDSLYYKSKR